MTAWRPHASATGRSPVSRFSGTTGSASQEIRERPRFRDTISRTVPFPDRQLRTLMTRTEILQRLQTIKEKGTQALRLLESKPLSVDTRTEIRNLAHCIKDELHNEYNRMLPEREQKTLS